MAEYKYRALGWQDDDIASLNVVDGTAADNQVELQITKQGTGGTIDGPAIVGKDGITINKVADSQKIEISGSGLVQMPSPTPTYWAVLVYEPGQKKYTTYPMEINVSRLTVPYRDYDKMNFKVGDLTAEDDGQYCANKKYVDDNFVKKVDPISSNYQVYGVDTDGEKVFKLDNSEGAIGTISRFWPEHAGNNPPYGHLLTNTPIQPYHCANKKYVDDAVAGLNPQFKTLFGSQSIVGTGNIDLYKHHVKLSNNSGTYSFEYYTDIISSQNFPIESLTDLKTYLGNEFVKDIYGEGTEDTDTTIGIYMTQAAIKYLQAGSLHAHSISTATITDTVTTI